MASDHIIDSDGDIVFDAGSFFVHNNRRYCEKEFVVGAIYGEGTDIRFAMVDPYNPEAEGDFDTESESVLFLHPGMFKFVDPKLLAGMTVVIRTWEDMVSRYGDGEDPDSVYSVEIEEDRCCYTSSMNTLAGKELVLECDVNQDTEGDDGIRNFIQKVTDANDSTWYITAGMVDVVESIESPEFVPGLDFLKAIGAA